MQRMLGQLSKPIARLMYRVMVDGVEDKGILVWTQADFLAACGRKNNPSSRAALGELEQEGYIFRDRYITDNGGQGKLVVLTPDLLTALGVITRPNDYPF